jgi:voltage-gated potassium channel
MPARPRWRRLAAFRTRLRHLYYGHRPAAVAFQAGLLVLDIAAIAYFISTSFVADPSRFHTIDLLLGGIFALELVGRLLGHRHPMGWVDYGGALLDLVVIASLFAPALGGNLGFLRILRSLRLLRSYNVIGRLKKQFPSVRRNEEVIGAAVNLGVFVFLFSAVVYATQHGANPKIVDYVDALYFTVATLSTTGFGDVTLIGSTSGELLSIGMMLIGITLFLRLAQAVFRPGGKVFYPCPQCGLQRHELDAVRCKACGQVLNIPNDEE